MRRTHVRWFVPSCWRDFARRPDYGLDVHAVWDSEDYVEKLILALEHFKPKPPRTWVARRPTITL